LSDWGPAMMAPPLVELPPRLPVRELVELLPLKELLPDRPRLLPIGPLLDVEPKEPVVLPPDELLLPKEEPLLPKEEPLLPKDEPLLDPLLPNVLLVREPLELVLCANAPDDQANSAAPTNPEANVILYRRIMEKPCQKEEPSLLCAANIIGRSLSHSLPRIHVTP